MGAETRSRLIPTHAGKTRGRSRTPCAKPAHPRSRGENAGAGHLLGLNQGSSPLTRGKRRSGHMVNVRCRLIPAHAGKTLEAATREADEGAHPRSRGENSSPRIARAGYDGSSPLTRGKLRER